jgi:CDP-glycerol glycerophosphotransferase (TagB/SpsB family)
MLMNITLPVTLLYIDPGSGSLLLYALVGLSATFFFTLRGFWYSLQTRVFRKKSSHPLPQDLPPLVLHSEGSKYWQVFEPVLTELGKRGIPCAFVSSDLKDYEMACKLENVTAIYPGKEMATFAYLNRIKADYVVTTSPHLNIYMMKRSPWVKKYIYLFHAPTSIDTYELYGFNHYDVLLTPGDFVETYVRELEEKRNLPQKDLYSVGCTYFDYMLKEKELLEDKKEGQKPVLLYAVTWGSRSSLLHHGQAMFDILDRCDCKVIFRPHPQYYVSHKEVIDQLETKIQSMENMSIDRNRTGMESMNQADLMVSDMSGVLFDFSYIYTKPLILLDAGDDFDGFEGGDLSSNWESEYSRKLAVSLPMENVESLPELVKETLARKENYKDEIIQIRDSQLAHFGKAGAAVADALQKIMVS